MDMLSILVDVNVDGFVYSEFDANEFPGYSWKKVLSGGLRSLGKVILPVSMQTYQVGLSKAQSELDCSVHIVRELKATPVQIAIVWAEILQCTRKDLEVLVKDKVLLSSEMLQKFRLDYLRSVVVFEIYFESNKTFIFPFLHSAYKARN